ncbi:MAG: pyruvate kinase [Pirellulaceae bacterium]
MSPSKPSIADAPRTKLVATLGPASSDPAILRKLIANGVDVFRLNMAHANIELHQQAVDSIRAAAKDENKPVGILVDLAGPKIRLGKLLNEPLPLELDQTVTFIRGDESKDPFEFTCGYARLLDEIQVGHDIVLADGIARLTVTEKTDDRAVCRVVDAGTIRSRQGVNLPGTHLSISAFGDIDKTNARWAAKAGVDFVSLSFVRNAAEVEELKSLLAEEGSSAQVIAKIEKREALDNLEEIVAAADGVMVARGDLGVEIDIEKTPLAQKRIIRTCLQHGKPVIVATQMLESMHHSKQPTRAEVSDVANAILDGADACMLSGETAIGDYPLEAVRMMKKIMKETEQMLRYRPSRLGAHENSAGWEIMESVLLGAAQIARRLDAKLVAMVTGESRSALVKSKQRDFITTVCLTSDPTAAQRMCLYWGIAPFVFDSFPEFSKLTEFVAKWSKTNVGLDSGERIVMILDDAVLPGVHDTVVVSQTP